MKKFALVSAALLTLMLGSCDQALNSCLAVFTINTFLVSPNPANVGQTVNVAWEIESRYSTFPSCDIAVITASGTDLLASGASGKRLVSFTAAENGTVAIDCSQICGDNEMRTVMLTVNE